MGKRLSEKNPFLRDAEKKKRLMVSVITSAQRQEGIEISEQRAEEVYKIVFEEPPVAFFRLVQGGVQREEIFVKALSAEAPEARFDVARRDLLAVDGAPLSYWLPTEVLQLFRAVPALQPGIGEARQGLATANDPRFVRQRWEVPSASAGQDKPWVPFAKGGEFCRFYSDIDLVVWWRNNGHDIRTFEGAYIRNESLYFRPGLTWPLAAKVFNVRTMPAGCIFGHKGPGIFPREPKDCDFLLGVLNSSMALYLCKARTSREEMGGRWEVGVIQKLPIPRPAAGAKARIAALARTIHDAKAAWDEGNEVSTRFREPWLARALRNWQDAPLATVLAALETEESKADADIQRSYAELDTAVFDAYGLSPDTRETVLKDLGARPPELIWPQMEGKSAEQRWMEHVWRLLSFCVKRVLERDGDGIVPLVKCSNEPPLEERVLGELERIVGTDRLHELEGEVASELRKRVPGYKRTDSIGDWLTNVSFEYHVRLYKSRPIYWHLASSQQADPAFGVLVHDHRFGKDALRKLRGSYVRGWLDRLERELGHARKEKRADDIVDLERRIDEVRAFDEKLQDLDEGRFPIHVPWKDAASQPKGWSPDIADGVKVNILPLQRAGLLRIPKVVSTASEEYE